MKPSRTSKSSESLDKVAKKLDMVIVILLAQSGLTLKETAEVLKVSEDTIERMLPFKKLKSKMQED